MKKNIAIVLYGLCLVSIILAGCQREDGSMNLLWSMGCLAVAAASVTAGKALYNPDKEKEI